MVRPPAKRPFCPDPSVTLQVLRLRRTRFEDEVGIAVECSLIEPQLTHRPDGISTGKRPSQLGCRTKRDRATSTTSKWIASGSPTIRLIDCFAGHLLPQLGKEESLAVADYSEEQIRNKDHTCAD